jgi:hypothetical protein
MSVLSVGTILEVKLIHKGLVKLISTSNVYYFSMIWYDLTPCFVKCRSLSNR